MRLDEYSKYDAVGLADLVRRKDVTAAELQIAALEALRAVDPCLNIASHVLDPDLSRSTDRSALFCGVPFMLKNLDHGWGGLPSSMGSRIAKGYSSDCDAPFAARLKSSGLRPIAITNSSEFGINGVTEPVSDGPCHNPWNTSLSPGGSSGGSAVAVAAGVVPMAHASDGGGSIRVPAAWCGLVGLKPSRGRNPLNGANSTDGSSWIGVQHVVSKTVRDSAAALDILSGPQPGDYVPLLKSPDSFAKVMATPPGRLRIAFATQQTNAPETHRECAKAVTETAKLLENLGHHVEEATPPMDYDHIADLCFDLFLPGMIEAIEDISAITGNPIGPDTLEPQTLATLAAGRDMSALTFKKRLSQLSELSRMMGEFMTRYDVFLTPTVTQMPPPLGRHSGHRYTSNDVSFWREEMDLYSFCAIFSISGQPAMSLPMHMTPDGLPVGVQISAAINEEATLFRLASQLEQVKPWIAQHPKIHAAKTHPKELIKQEE